MPSTFTSARDTPSTVRQPTLPCLLGDVHAFHPPAAAHPRVSRQEQSPGTARLTRRPRRAVLGGPLSGAAP
jgi:hypothetical protein